MPRLHLGPAFAASAGRSGRGIDVEPLSGSEPHEGVPSGDHRRVSQFVRQVTDQLAPGEPLEAMPPAHLLDDPPGSPKHRIDPSQPDSPAENMGVGPPLIVAPGLAAPPEMDHDRAPREPSPSETPHKRDRPGPNGRDHSAVIVPLGPPLQRSGHDHLPNHGLTGSRERLQPVGGDRRLRVGPVAPAVALPEAVGALCPPGTPTGACGTRTGAACMDGDRDAANRVLPASRDRDPLPASLPPLALPGQRRADGSRGYPPPLSARVAG